MREQSVTAHAGQSVSAGVRNPTPLGGGAHARSRPMQKPLPEGKSRRQALTLLAVGTSRHRHATSVRRSARSQRDRADRRASSWPSDVAGLSLWLPSIRGSVALCAPAAAGEGGLAHGPGRGTRARLRRVLVKLCLSRPGAPCAAGKSRCKGTTPGLKGPCGGSKGPHVVAARLFSLPAPRNSRFRLRLNPRF